MLYFVGVCCVSLFYVIEMFWRVLQFVVVKCSVFLDALASLGLMIVPD